MNFNTYRDDRPLKNAIKRLKDLLFNLKRINIYFLECKPLFINIRIEISIIVVINIITYG